MKSFYHILLSGAIATSLITGCSKSFLQRTPQSSLEEAALTNKKGVNTLLIGVYGALDGQDRKSVV